MAIVLPPMPATSLDTLSPLHPAISPLSTTMPQDKQPSCCAGCSSDEDTTTPKASKRKTVSKRQASDSEDSAKTKSAKKARQTSASRQSKKPRQTKQQKPSADQDRKSKQADTSDSLETATAPKTPVDLIVISCPDTKLAWRFSCRNCIAGHRAPKCNPFKHWDRLLIRREEPGRPTLKCGHADSGRCKCRSRRETFVLLTMEQAKEVQAGKAPFVRMFDDQDEFWAVCKAANEEAENAGKPAVYRFSDVRSPAPKTEEVQQTPSTTETEKKAQSSGQVSLQVQGMSEPVQVDMNQWQQFLQFQQWQQMQAMQPMQQIQQMQQRIQEQMQQLQKLNQAHSQQLVTPTSAHISMDQALSYTNSLLQPSIESAVKDGSCCGPGTHSGNVVDHLESPSQPFTTSSPVQSAHISKPGIESFLSQGSTGQETLSPVDNINFNINHPLSTLSPPSFLDCSADQLPSSYQPAGFMPQSGYDPLPTSDFLHLSHLFKHGDAGITVGDG